MSKIKPQIKKIIPVNLITALGGNVFGAVCLIGEMVFKLFGGNKKDKKK
ncbi:hypothetical protein BD0134_07980 [Helicobacter pylori]